MNPAVQPDLFAPQPPMVEPARTAVRDTSHEAIARLRATKQVNRRQGELLEGFARRPVGTTMTRQELARELGWQINQVCGRVKELLDAGRLTEGAKRECRVTGQQAYPLALANLEEKHDGRDRH